jgi:alpha-glucosidase
MSKLRGASTVSTLAEPLAPEKGRVPSDSAPPPSSGVVVASSTSVAPANTVQYRYVPVDQFQPNVDGWQLFGSVERYSRVGSAALRLENEAGYALLLTFLSPSALRVQFRPEVGATYAPDAPSYAVTNRSLGAVQIAVTEVDRGGPTLRIETGSLTVYIGLAPYGMSIYRDGQLISEDCYGKNLIFSNQAMACLRKAPSAERYYGFGEKAGAQLDKKHFTMTCFNYDNFMYSGSSSDGVIPQGNQGGPLNPSEPLYNSMPFMLAVGSSPGATPGDGAPLPYAYGLFLDNVAQSYFNMGSSDYSDMSGKYYFGALFGDLDYYVLVGSGAGSSAIRSVLDQYSMLTGRATMPPKYALGYHQGCYGYYDSSILLGVAQAFRDAQIPIDGLHIDVDFQNNYRTFTSSPNKFPNPEGMFDTLHQMGFKCSTNITGIISANPLDEDGNRGTPYPARDAFVSIGLDNTINVKPGVTPPFLFDTRASQGESSNLFLANEDYGSNDTPIYPNGKNPNRYPTPLYPNGQDALGTYGFYSDMGRPDVQQWWGRQYQYLLDIGLDMVWQDMTCPAVVPNIDNDSPVKTLPLDLMMFDKVTGQYQPNAVVHNAFALNLVQATYEGLTKLRAGSEMSGKYNFQKRNFIIARGGFAGLHRYAGIWTGDSASSWDFLRINLPEVLNIGLSGQALSGCDIGGFANGSGSAGQGITDYELFTRWMNLGAFLPWYRNHYDGYTKLFQEPYRYGEPVPTNCRKYIELRYRLIQLFYDAMYESTQSGLPICRALFLNDAQDPNVFAHCDDQFFLGDSLLVAPVVNPGQEYRDVYLPAESSWYVLSDNTAPLGAPTPGGTTQTWYAPLGVVPVYVREGAILPLRAVEQYVGQDPGAPLTFNIYPGKDTSYTLYQDDEVSTANVVQSAYRVTQVSHQGIPNGQRVRVQRLEDRFTPQASYYYVAFLGTRAPTSVSIDGTPLVDRGNPEALSGAGDNGYYFNASITTTYVKVIDNRAEMTLTVTF